MKQLVDLSSFQGDTIPDVAGVYLKATEGLTWNDWTFAAKLAAARAKRVPAGAYHFGHPANDPILEARHFWAVIGAAALDLLPMLDIETTDGLPAGKVAAWVQTFLTEFTRLGGTIGVYTFRDFITAGNLAGCGGHPLWYARIVPGWTWQQVAADVPPPFTPADLVLWQYGTRGIDLDQCPDLSPLMGDDMLTPADRAAVVADLLTALADPAKAAPVARSLASATYEVQRGGVSQQRRIIDMISTADAGAMIGLPQLLTAVQHMPAPAGDPQALADALHAQIAQLPADVVDALTARLVAATPAAK